MSTHMIVTCMQVESSPDEVRRSNRVKKQRVNVVEDEADSDAGTVPYNSPAKPEGGMLDCEGARRKAVLKMNE